MKHLTENSSTLNIIRIIILLAIAFLLFVLIFNIAKTRPFIKIEATVFSMKTDIDYGLENDSKSSLIKSVNCYYEYDGEKHESSYRTFFKNYSPGETISVYLNPKNPSEIKNPFITEVCVLGIVFLTCFVTLLWISQRKNYGK